MHSLRVRIVAILGALIGVSLLIVATLTVNGTALQSFRTLDQQARAQDKSVASTSPQPCANPRLQVSAPKRVLLDSEIEVISVQVTNDDTVQCDITVSLVAPKFTLQPTDNQQLISLAPTTSSTLRWTVAPTAVGLYTLAFTAGNASQQIGVSIVSGNGFSPIQPQTLNYLAIFFGLLLTLVSLSLFAWRGSPKPRPKASPVPTSELSPNQRPQTPPEPPEPQGSPAPAQGLPVQPSTPTEDATATNGGQ